MRKWYLIWLLVLPLAMWAQYSIPLSEEDNGNKYLTVSIGGLAVDFTFDTGCSSVSINRNIFHEMLRCGIIKREDVYDELEAEMANGERHVVQRFFIKRMQIGDYELHNIQASVGVDDQPDATPLFGQSVLERFSSYTISNNRLYFKPKPEDEQMALYQATRLRNDTTSASQRQIAEALKPFVNRLSPRYLVIYAEALRKTGEYKQAIAMYHRIKESGIYREDEQYSLQERLVHAEIWYAERLYNDSLYDECEQMANTVLQHAQPAKKYQEEIRYVYNLLCYLHLLQNDYARAEQSIIRYANAVLAPNTCNDLLEKTLPANEELAKLFYYLSNHFAVIEDYESAQRYKRLCDNIGGYSQP